MRRWSCCVAVLMLALFSRDGQTQVPDTTGRTFRSAYLQPAYTVAAPTAFPSQNFPRAASVAPAQSPRVGRPLTPLACPAPCPPAVPVVMVSSMDVPLDSTLECGAPAESACWGTGLFGQDTLYIPGQPMRNVLRSFGF